MRAMKGIHVHNSYFSVARGGSRNFVDPQERFVIFSAFAQGGNHSIYHPM